MTELEQKAEEYVKAEVCGWFDYCKDCINKDYRRLDNMCNPAKWVKQAYIDGYEQGQKEIEELKWEQKQILEDNEFYQKENEELKAQIEKMKCCENCKHLHSGCLKKLSIIYLCDNLNKWELADEI